MKKKSLMWLLVGVTSVAMMGCSSYTFTSRSNTIANSDIYAGAPCAKIDVDYSKRVTATSDEQRSRKDAENQAVYKVILEQNVDVVVDPIFKIEIHRGLATKYIATVHGYAGYYKVIAPQATDKAEANKSTCCKDCKGNCEITNYYINTCPKDCDKVACPKATDKCPAKKACDKKACGKKKMNIGSLIGK